MTEEEYKDILFRWADGDNDGNTDDEKLYDLIRMAYEAGQDDAEDLQFKNERA